MILTIGNQYICKSNGNMYQITDKTIVKIDDKWIDAVIYKPIEYSNTGPNVFVRLVDDFINKFDERDWQEPIEPDHKLTISGFKSFENLDAWVSQYEGGGEQYMSDCFGAEENGEDFACSVKLGSYKKINQSHYEITLY